MKYNQLQEAIIKVPPEILTKVNTYVASYLYFKIQQYIKRIDIMLPSNTAPEEKQRILQDAQNTLGKLQRQYGAKNISAQTAQDITNKSLKIPFDVETFYQQLNYKGITPELVNLMKDRLNLSLLIKTGESHGIGGSQENNSNYSVLVTVVTNKLNPKDFLGTASKIMSNAYHELQHAVQSMAIQKINPEDKQLQMKKDYSNEWDQTDYYTSGIEFSPQLGNVVDLLELELQKSSLKKELNPNKNQAINAALNNAMQQSNESRTFLIKLHQHNQEGYRKALSTIYKKVSPIYDDLKANGIDFSTTELPEEELETNVDVMLSIYKMMYKIESYKTKAYGSNKENIRAIDFESNSWKIEIYRINGDKSNYGLKLTGYDPYVSEEMKLNAKEVLNLCGILSDITWYDASEIIDDLEFITGERKDVNDDNIRDMLESLKSDADMMDVQFEYSNDKFSVFGKTFTIEKIEDTQVKVDVHYDDKTLYVWSLKQILIAFQMMIRYYTTSPDEVVGILEKDTMYIEFMTDLRNL